jgi:hypothetical protein
MITTFELDRLILRSRYMNSVDSVVKDLQVLNGSGFKSELITEMSMMPIRTDFDMFGRREEGWDLAVEFYSLPSSNVRRTLYEHLRYLLKISAAETWFPAFKRRTLQLSLNTRKPFRLDVLDGDPVALDEMQQVWRVFKYFTELKIEDLHDDGPVETEVAVPNPNAQPQSTGWSNIFTSVPLPK